MTEPRTAVVTGAAGGIGAACAERLAQDGFQIAIVDIKPADAVIERITNQGGIAKYFSCDLTQPAQISELIDTVEAQLGTCAVLVNNAGRYEFTPTETVDFELWRKIMALNVDGMFAMTQGVIPGMKRLGWGRIISITSNSCFAPPPGLTAYVSSKSAVIGYSRSLAGEIGKHGITVNTVSPGPILTEQARAAFYQGSDNQDPAIFDSFMADFVKTQAIPRQGLPEDVAPVVSFFASEGASYISGQTLVVDGGFAKH